MPLCWYPSMMLSFTNNTEVIFCGKGKVLKCRFVNKFGNIWRSLWSSNIWFISWLFLWNNKQHSFKAYSIYMFFLLAPWKDVCNIHVITCNISSPSGYRLCLLWSAGNNVKVMSADKKSGSSHILTCMSSYLPNSDNTQKVDDTLACQIFCDLFIEWFARDTRFYTTKEHNAWLFYNW